MQPNWYVVSAPAGGGEVVAERDLKRLGFKVFFPHFCEWIESRIDKCKSRFARSAYFPGYLFVEAIPDQFHKISESGKRQLVLGTQDETGYRAPFPITPEIMREFTSLADPAGQVREQSTFGRQRSNPFAIGSRVQFNEESRLFGFFAQVEAICPGGKSVRLQLEASMLGRESIVAKVRQLKKA